MSDRFLDLEAVESDESAEEENLDKYESNFIDDGNDNDRYVLFTSLERTLLISLVRAPISWSRTPSPTSEILPRKATTTAGTSASSKHTEIEVGSQVQ